MFLNLYKHLTKSLCLILAIFIALIGIVHIEPELNNAINKTLEKKSSVFLLAFLLDDAEDSPVEDTSDCCKEQKIECFLPFSNFVTSCFVIEISHTVVQSYYCHKNFAIELQSPPPEQKAVLMLTA